MRYILGFFIFFLFFGCADKDAFSKFNLTPKQELAFDNVQTVKIVSHNDILGVASVLYLGAIEKEKNAQIEKFYLQMFLKETALLKDFSITLNNQKPLYFEPLSKSNRYSNLLKIKNEWNNYYEIAFAKTDAKKLTLRVSFRNGVAFSVDFQKIL